MLVVDSVELAVCKHSQQVRELDGQRAARFEQWRDSRHEVVDVGNMGEDVVPADQIGSMPPAGQVLTKACAEEIDDGFDAILRSGMLGRVGRWLDSENGNACLLEVLEEIA